MVKIAILDDWQDVARSSADWSRLAARADLAFFADAFASEDEAALALADFDILLTMRSARLFPKPLSASPKVAHDQHHRRCKRFPGRRGLHASRRNGLQHNRRRPRSLRDGRTGARPDDRRRPRHPDRRQGHASRRFPARRACRHGLAAKRSASWVSAASGRASPATP